MSIESVYYEVKENVKPSLAAMYIYMRLKDGIVHIDSIAVSFATSDEKNIARMIEKSKEEGFMFFGRSFGTMMGSCWCMRKERAMNSACINASCIELRISR